MKWLEIIELRSVDKDWLLLKSQLERLISDLEKETKIQTVKIFSRLLIDTDFSIHLFHDSRKVDNEGSQLGLRIASSLKEFGLVNHRIWIELNSNDNRDT